MREIVSPLDGFLSPFGRQTGAPQIITAIIAPALAVLSDGDAIEDAFSANIDQTGNYASTAGAISSAVVAVTVNEVSADQTDLIEAGDVVAVTVTVTDSAANERVWSLSTTALAIAPAQFTSNMWSVAVNELTISSLPDDGGSALTDIEYNVDGGAWTSTGETTIGTYAITAADGTDVRIRAVNAIGEGTQSDPKMVTADAFSIGGASPELVAAFTVASDGTTAGEYYRKASSATTFGDLFTFSRSGTATYFDASGVLQTAATGVARRNAHYYNSAWVNGGLQLEAAAATNLADWSIPQPTNWTTIGGSLAIDSATLLGLTNGASVFTEDTSTGGHNFYDFIAAGGTAGVTYTYSLYVKANGRTAIRITRGSSAMGFFQHNFDLTAGTATLTSGLSCGIESLGNGEYRIFGSWTQASNGGSGIVFSLVDAGNTSYTGDGTSGVICYGFQIEVGSIPTSFILTDGSTVTRAAETLSIAGADTPANTTAMSISMKGLMTYADGGAAAQETFARWYVDANNFITLDLDTDSTATGEVNANQSSAGTLDTVVAGAEYSPGVNVAFNIASRHTSGAINVAKDGTAATADTTPVALADLSGAAFQPGYDFSGFITELRVWGADIGDSGIAEVTT